MMPLSLKPTTTQEDDMAKAFKKGDRVTAISSWDNRGTVAFIQCVVRSCGAKQLLLTIEATGKPCDIGLWRSLVPAVATGDDMGVHHRLEGEALHSTLRAASLRFLNEERTRLNSAIKRTADHGLPSNFSHAMKNTLSRLHEPRSFDYVANR